MFYFSKIGKKYQYNHPAMPLAYRLLQNSQQLHCFLESGRTEEVISGVKVFMPDLHSFARTEKNPDCYSFQQIDKPDIKLTCYKNALLALAFLKYPLGSFGLVFDGYTFYLVTKFVDQLDIVYPGNRCIMIQYGNITIYNENVKNLQILYNFLEEEFATIAITLDSFIDLLEENKPGGCTGFDNGFIHLMGDETIKVVSYNYEDSATYSINRHAFMECFRDFIVHHKKYGLSPTFATRGIMVVNGKWGNVEFDIRPELQNEYQHKEYEIFLQKRKLQIKDLRDIIEEECAIFQKFGVG